MSPRRTPTPPAARAPRRCAALLAAAIALAACTSVPRATEEQRAQNADWVKSTGAALAAKTPRVWMAVQGAAVVATGPTADDAVRAAGAAKVSGPRAHQRFVFRADDAGDRLHRLAFLPAGGLVAGRKALSDLGLRVVSVTAGAAGRPMVLERHGSRRTVDLAKTPRLRFELAPLGGTATTSIDVTIDPDFDGPLLLPADAAADLDLTLAEIPGRADVQVALGRPFAGRRAWVTAKCEALDAAGAVETIVPDAPPPKK